MTTTSPDRPATCWRDLADLLTPEQLAHLEGWERLPELPRTDGTLPADVERQASLLFTAREYVGRNVAGIRYADVALPPDTDDAGEWVEWDTDDLCRWFTGTRRTVVGQAAAEIIGWQHTDGRIEREIVIHSEGLSSAPSVTPAQARELAAALIEAADEVDRLDTAIVR